MNVILYTVHIIPDVPEMKIGIVSKIRFGILFIYHSSKFLKRFKYTKIIDTMKGFIELTSICGNTRLFRANTITQVVKKVYFDESEYEGRPELKERKEWACIIQECACNIYYVQESYEDVLAMMEKALKQQ